MSEEFRYHGKVSLGIIHSKGLGLIHLMQPGVSDYLKMVEFDVFYLKATNFMYSRNHILQVLTGQSEDEMDTQLDKIKPFYTLNRIDKILKAVVAV